VTRERLARLPAPVLGFLIALVVYGGALGVMRPVPSGDEPHYALEAISLARDGDRDMRDEYADAGLIHAVTALPALDPHARDFGDGRLVSTHGVGLPLLLTPVAAVTTSVTAMRLELLLLAALAAAVLLRIVRRFDDGWRGWAAWALVAFSLPVVAYATQLYPELPGALCLLLGVNGILAGPRRRWEWLLGAAATAFLPWLHVRYLPIVAGLVVVFLARLWRDRRDAPVALPLVLAAAPIALSGAAMAYAFNRWYGSPLPTVIFGSSDVLPAVGPPVDASAAAAAAAPVPSAADYVQLLLDNPSPRVIYRSVVAAVLTPGGGWLPYAPVHVVALAGVAALAVLRWRWAVAGVLLAGGYLALLFASTIESQYTFPGRYVIVVLPLAAIALAAALRSRVGVVAAGALGAVSALILFAGVTRPGEMIAANSSKGTDLPVVHQMQPLLPVTAAFDTKFVSHRPARDRGRSTATTVRSEPVEIDRGTYNAAFVLRSGPGDPAARAVLQVRRADGQPVTEMTVRASEVPGERVFTMPFQATGTVAVRTEVRLSPPGGLRAGGVQVAGTLPWTKEPPAYYQWPRTLGWALLTLGLAAALAYALVSSSRRLRQRA
jgi:hypothetical protein